MSDTPETPVPDTSPETGAPEQSADTELQALQERLAEAEAAAQSARDAHMRLLAELDNVRKRTERETHNAAKYGAEKLLGELLGICDSLELGLKAAESPEAQLALLVEGMQLTQKQLFSVLEKHGVSQVNPVGEPFNPDFHEAISMVPSPEVAPNHVLNVMQKGYRLHDRLLRPAMVVVARAP